MKLKLPASLAIGGIFSMGTLWLAYKNIPLANLFHYMQSINYLWLIPAVLVSISSFILRVFRWQIILKSSSRISFTGTFHPLMTGFMLNCVLPGRIGEIARPAILTRKEKIPFTTGLATIVAERVFDLICLITLLALFLRTINIDPSFVVTVGDYLLTGEVLTSVSSGMATLCIVLVLGIATVSVSYSKNVIISIVLKLPDLLVFLKKGTREFLKEKIAVPITGIINNVASGFKLIKSPVNVVYCLAISFAIWMVQAFSYHIITWGCPGISLNYFEITTVMVIICFFIALPSVPGFWGLWEAGGIFALTLFSVARDSAAGYTLINHVIQIVPVIIIGMISAFIIGINLKQLYKPEPPPPDGS